MNRYRVAYQATKRNGSRKQFVRNVEVENFKLDKACLEAITNCLTIAHSRRSDEVLTQEDDILRPDVKVTSVQGVSARVKDLLWPKLMVTPAEKEETTEETKSTSAAPPSHTRAARRSRRTRS